MLNFTFNRLDANTIELRIALDGIQILRDTFPTFEAASYYASEFESNHNRR